MSSPGEVTNFKNVSTHYSLQLDMTSNALSFVEDAVCISEPKEVLISFPFAHQSNTVIYTDTKMFR